MRAAVPDRTNGVNHVFCGKPVAGGEFGVAGRTAVQRLALAQQAGAGRAMDRAVHAAAAEQRGVRGVHDGVDGERRDVHDSRLDAAFSEGEHDGPPCALVRNLAQPRTLTAKARRGRAGLFRLRVAPEQGAHGVARRHAVEQHGAYRLGDRHVDLMRARDRQHGARAAHAFGHVAERAEDVVERAPARQLLADGAVARQVAGGGKDEVAEARETRKGLRAAAERHAQTRHFRETARDERGACVQAEAESVRDAGGDGKHVLDRAAHFHADDVVAGIDAHRTVMECGERALAAVGRRTRDRERDGQTLAHFARETRAGQHAIARVVGQFRRDDLMRHQLRVGFEAFAKPHEMRGHAAHVAHRAQHVAQARHGCAEHDQIRFARAVVERGSEIGFVLERFRQRDARQIAGVLVRFTQGVDERAIARPQHRVMRLGQMARQRGAPRSGAENGDFHSDTPHRLVRSAIKKRSMRGVAGAVLLLRDLLQALLVERLEVDLGEVDRREARTRDRVGDVRAQIREQDGRASDADERIDLFRRDVADVENAGLLGFDQERNLVLDLGGDRAGDEDLEHRFREAFGLDVDFHFNRRHVLLKEDGRRVRLLERQVLEVNALDVEERLVILVRHGVWLPD
ncbi:hypothetical protein PT2222_10387 [Paraburkholderia tropica]